MKSGKFSYVRMQEQKEQKTFTEIMFNRGIWVSKKVEKYYEDGSVKSTEIYNNTTAGTSEVYTFYDSMSRKVLKEFTYFKNDTSVMYKYWPGTIDVKTKIVLYPNKQEEKIEHYDNGQLKIHFIRDPENIIKSECHSKDGTMVKCPDYAYRIIEDEFWGRKLESN